MTGLATHERDHRADVLRERPRDGERCPVDRDHPDSPGPREHAGIPQAVGEDRLSQLLLQTLHGHIYR